MRHAFLATLTAAVASLAVAASAQATYPGQNGLISWSTSRGYTDGSSAIWGQRAFGTEIRRLTFHKDSAAEAGGVYRSDTDASWRGDGGAFVFSRAFGVGPRLFVKTLGEGRPQRVPLGHTAAEQPAFAPDGGRIAFVKVGPSDEPLGRGPLSVVVTDVDGSHVRRLGAGGGPVWTPDGQRIVWEGERGGRARLISIRPDGTGKHVFPKRCAGAADPSFAPSGDRMAVGYSPAQGGPYRIWTMGLDCRDKHQITLHRPAMSPAWSPDGRWIAYYAPSKGKQPAAIRAVRPDGTDDRLVRENDGGLDLDWQPRP
jgi:Tol biopolymer transport system component